MEHTSNSITEKQNWLQRFSAKVGDIIYPYMPLILILWILMNVIAVFMQII